MRQRFKARELWLFAPFLLIGALAFWWQGREARPKPQPRSMYVSDFKAESAPGYWQERGFSHQVTVTISPGWPRPEWTNDCCNGNGPADPLHPEALLSSIASLPLGRRKQTAWTGGVLTTTRNGIAVRQTKVGEERTTKYSVDEDGNYVFVSFVRLNSVPSEAGAVKFRGLYSLAGLAPLKIEREIRKAGETMPSSNDRTTGGQIIKVVVDPFVNLNDPSRRDIAMREEAEVHIIYRRQKNDNFKSALSSSRIYDVEIVDEKGNIHRYNRKGNFDFEDVGWSAAERKLKKQLVEGEDVNSLSVHLDSLFKARHKLTLRGKISVNENWPLKFETPL